MRYYKIFISFLLVSILLATVLVNPSTACTGIRLIAKDSSVVYGRVLQWGEFDLQTRVRVIPRGYAFTGQTPEGLNGKKWQAKYGVVGLDALHLDYLLDGMNEKGLAMGLFYFAGFGKFNQYEKNKAENTINTLDVINYVLTQFATIAEVREGMSKVRVIAVNEKVAGMPIIAHWMVTEPTGKSIVIEYTDGRLKIFDNTLGVITNAPSYDWHEINLRNYIEFTDDAHPAKIMGGKEYAPLGFGSNMLGLPGDFTPPSRFVRAVAWTQTARPTPTSSETVYEAFRILDNFNVPLPVITKPTPGDDLTNMRSATQWTTVWDLANRVLYYTTQDNRRVRAIDVKTIDFSKIGNKMLVLPLDKKREQDIEYIKVE